MNATQRPQKWMDYLILAALVGGLWLGVTPQAEAQDAPSLPPTRCDGIFVVRLGQGEMVRLSSHNLTTENVLVTFALVDFEGTNLGRGLIDKPISLAPGKGAFVDIPSSAILGPNHKWAEATGIVSFSAGKKAANAAGGNLAASLLVLDEATHGTLLVVPSTNITDPCR